MKPVRVTAPDGPVVTLEELKVHLRVDHDEEDALISSLQDAAVAMLEGWGGPLGRCILPQRWAVDVVGPGPHELPFPDASEIDAEFDGAPVDVVEVTHIGSMQPSIVLPHVAHCDRVTVSAEFALPPERLPAAKALVKLIVGNWYLNREAVVIGTISSELPFAAKTLIAGLQWYRI